MILNLSRVEDLVAALDLCDVELLKMRFLDEQLDDLLAQVYGDLIKCTTGEADRRKVA